MKFTPWMIPGLAVIGLGGWIGHKLGAAKALADRQLIARQAHEADGRSHHLELTETGWSLYDAIVPAALASESQLESNISAGERAALLAILAKLTAAAEDYG